jgi:hypothetical protein
MFCATCGATNAEGATRCGKCGAFLEKQVNFPATMSPPDQAFSGTPWSIDRQPTVFSTPAAQGSPEQSLFAPIAHSPFSNEPLPQPSQPLPTLIQPSGDILTFTPAAQPSTPPEHTAYASSPPPAQNSPSSYPDSNLELADYPTNAQMPVPMAPLMPAGYANNPAPQLEEQRPFASPGQNVGFAAYAAPQQGGIASSPNPGNYQAWVEEEPYADFFQAPPISRPLGNVYPGPADQGFQAPHTGQTLGNVYPGLPRGRSSFASGSLSDDPGINPFIRPLPLWASLGGTAAGALLLVALVFLNPDWASGAMIAGMIAIVLAILLVIAAGVRVALGLLSAINVHRRAQIISTTLLIVLLFLFSGIGISQQTALHAWQARSLEGQHSWQSAIAEYQAAGETAPGSENLARVYNEWGEDLSGQRQYASAVAKFNAVLQQYPQASGQRGRARSDMIKAYLSWGDAAFQQQDYAGATSHYGTLLALPYCDATCSSLAQPKDATAYDRLAEQQLAASQFGPAVNAFKTLTTRFSHSPEAGQVHADYAKALWGLGQQQLKTTCADAVTTYRQLASQFADTTQGKQAGTALRQPVQVKGHFTTTIPGPPSHPTVALVQGLSVGIQQFQFPPLLRQAPTTQIKGDGTFSFSAVPQGTYELVWSSDGVLHFYYARNGNQVLYTAHLGPLCPYNYGDINVAIPTTR